MKRARRRFGRAFFFLETFATDMRRCAQIRWLFAPGLRAPGSPASPTLARWGGRLRGEISLLGSRRVKSAPRCRIKSDQRRELIMVTRPLHFVTLSGVPITISELKWP